MPKLSLTTSPARRWLGSATLKNLRNHGFGFNGTDKLETSSLQNELNPSPSIKGAMIRRNRPFLSAQTRVGHKKIWILTICLFFVIIWLYIHQVILRSDIETLEMEFVVNETFQEKSKESKPLLCSCIKMHHDGISSLNSSSVSTCSEFSTRRGRDQKVVSYSYYNPDIRDQKGSKPARRYLEGVSGRAAEIKSYYPGWVMRIYHNVSQNDAYGSEVLCSVYCNNDHIDLCDVSELPAIGSMYEKHNGMFWRFLALGDPTVQFFLSRDLDSIIQQREVDAVTEWLKSNATFHVMRDHPHHNAVVLGGLWGTKNSNGRENLRRIRDRLLHSRAIHKYNYDQMTLEKVLWPIAQKDILQHDSFNCKMKSHKNSVPFPTRRTLNVYVGWGPVEKEGPLKAFQQATCPLVCRPAKHPDWATC